MRKEYVKLVEELEDKLAKVEEAIDAQMDRDTNFITAGGGSGTKNVEKLENLETRYKELEWLRT